MMNKHDKWKKSFVIDLEPLIRRGEEVYVIWKMLGSFPHPPLRAHTRDSNGHSQVSPARETPHLPIYPPLTAIHVIGLVD